MILHTTIYYPVQALEYLLWASISLELSIPLMTAKYLPWISTLYCAVCQCYYDNQAAVLAEVKDTRHLHPDTYKNIIIAMSTDLTSHIILAITCSPCSFLSTVIS